MKKRLLTVLSVILTFLMLGGTFSFAANVPSVSVDKFQDVAEADWFYNYVKFVADPENNQIEGSKKVNWNGNAIMNGTSETTFDPQNDLTRAMFATILARYDQAVVDDSKATIFNDVEVNQWYTGSIGWANEKTIVQGYGDGNFGTNDSISRQDLALMIYRYIKNYYEPTKKVKIKVHGGEWKGDIQFTDKDEIRKTNNEETVTAVNNCVDYGLILGYPDGTFKPTQNITRAETAAIIYRLTWLLNQSGGSGGSGSGNEQETAVIDFNPVLVDEDGKPVVDENGNPVALVDQDGKPINDITITYDPENPDQEIVVGGSQVPIPAAPEGLSFVGWKVTLPNGQTVVYGPGETIPLMPGTYKLQAVFGVAYIVKASMSGPSALKVKWPVDLQKEYSIANDGTGDPTIDKVMKDLVSGDNAKLIENALGSVLEDLDVYHAQTVVVDGSTYVVTVDFDSKKIEATKDGVAVNDWDAQLKVEQDLYQKRADAIAEAAKISDAGVSAEWKTFVDALSPENMFIAAPDSLQFKEKSDYLKAIQDAAINAGVVLKKLGEKGLSDSYGPVADYMSESLGIKLGAYTIDGNDYAEGTAPDATTVTTLSAALKEDGIVLPLTENGTKEYVALDAKDTVTRENLVELVNTRISRAWMVEPDNAGAIVAFMKANQADSNSKFFGDYELKITIKKK